MFKPMLADKADLKKLKYPVMASPKLDGVRATFSRTHTLVSRSLKPFPNKAIDLTFLSNRPMDGELIVGDAFSKTVFRDTMKVVMAHEADISDLRMHVFDLVTEGKFIDRFKAVRDMADYKRLIPVPHVVVDDEKTLLIMEEEMLKLGFEGVMLRDPEGLYKQGRSTVSEGGLLKLKRMLSSEAKIVDFEEQMHNGNEATIDALGHTERSSHQANLTPMGCLGALVVLDCNTGVQFNIGTGFTHADRTNIWNLRDTYRGLIVTYEYLPVGVKDKPRHPTFKGFRDARDMS
jgi:DNA ligase-1